MRRGKYQKLPTSCAQKIATRGACLPVLWEYQNVIHAYFRFRRLYLIVDYTSLLSFYLIILIDFRTQQKMDQR